MEPKWRNSVASLTPARSATSRVVVPRVPLRSNSSRAADRILARLPGGELASDLRLLAYEIADHMIARRGMMCVSLAEDAAGTGDAPEWRGPAQIWSELASYFAAKVDAGLVRGEPTFVSRYFLGMLFSYVVGRKLWDSAVPDRAVLDGIVVVFLNGVSA